MLDQTGQNLLSAALRHVRDAEYLADPDGEGQSADQAYHLAGFGPECARKATLSAMFHRVLGHAMGGAETEQVLELAVALEPLGDRYALQGWQERCPELAGWSEQSRYERTGHRSPQEVTALVTQARSLVDEIVLALWADGRLPGDLP